MDPVDAALRRSANIICGAVMAASVVWALGHGPEVLGCAAGAGLVWLIIRFVLRVRDEEELFW